MKKVAALLPLLLLLSLVLAPRPAAVADPGDDGRAGAVRDMQGTALVQPAGRDRWTPLSARSLLMPGDRVRTMVRGANAVEIGLAGGGVVVLGPGSLVELPERGSIRFLRGEGEVAASESAAVRILGPGGSALTAKDTLLVRTAGAGLDFPAKPFPWLTGYRASTTDEWMGSLLAKIDGRNVPLTIGYHKVSVVIRDQVAETTVEESFQNSTGSVLEGTFSFPLPADASISGFGMWIGSELVMADIVERGRARQIYEDILRRRKDPGLLEWSGGNIFKASVFPIPARGEKRIKIRYTQVLPMEGAKLRYRYALRSELLRSHPLRSLSIRVRMLSTLPVAAAGSPSHEVTKDGTDHEIKLGYDAEEVTPERDFEAVFDLGGVSPLTVVPHRRGPDGYFALMLAPPDPAAGGLVRELSPEGDPVDLLILADTSGSMDAAQRATQEAFVDSLINLLGAKDTFRLGAVDRTVDWLSAEPVPVGEGSAAEAVGFLAKRPSLGWTDMARALAEGLGRAGPNTFVVYVGDGIGTAGDPDPARIVRLIERFRENARGTFHAVATGSSYEGPIMNALASLGGGSFREAASDPADAAYRLLAEAASPPVKDLSVRFEGVRTARVYPERLPNLPAGTQQIVLGRFLPGEGDAKGTVVVTGTLDGKPVRYVAPFKLAAGEEGNSFLPRLWARRHVDALMAEALTPEVREEVVAFSAEFGIMTPLTSFLVLENDEDRAFYGVERRVGMSDGERFFADAKDRVDKEVLREAMRKAGLWRKHLKAQMLAEIEDLGRSLPLAAYAYGYVGGIGVGGGGGGAWGPTSGSEAEALFGYEEGGAGERLLEYARLTDHNAFGVMDGELVDEKRLGMDGQGDGSYDGPAGEVPPGTREPSDPMGPTAPASTPAPAQEMAGKKMRSSTSIDRQPGDDRARYDRAGYEGARRALPGKPYGGLRREAAPAENALAMLFPRLAPAPVIPPDPERPAWPEELLALVMSLDRTAEIDALTGGLEIRSTSIGFHPLRRNETSRGTVLTLVTPSRWFVRHENRGSLPSVEWCGAKDRGIAREGTRLGRHRPAADNDRRFRLVVPGFFPNSWLQSYARWTAEIAGRDGDIVTIRFTWPDSDQQVLLVIDAARRLPLRSETWQQGKRTGATVWSEWTFVAELPFPSRTEYLDDMGRVTWRSETTAAARPEEDVAEEIAGRIAGTSDVVFLGTTLPTLDEAKQAVMDGDATFADRVAIGLDHIARQKWDEAWAEWAAAKKFIEGKPGTKWLEAALMSFSRRGEELQSTLTAMAEGLKADLGPSTAGRAELLYGFGSSVLGVNEQIALARTLDDCAKGLGAEGTALADLYEERIAQHLTNSGRAPEALAIRQAAAERDPRDPARTTRVVQSLLGLNRKEEALQVIEVALGNEAFWLDREAGQIHQQRVDLLWQARRLEEFLAATTRWIEVQPSREDAWQKKYTGLLFLGRIEELDRGVLEALATLPGEHPTPGALARLGASISFALGQSWNYWSPQLHPRYWKPLGDAALRLARRDDQTVWHTTRILNDWRFRQTDEYRRVVAAIRTDLFDGKAALTMSVLRLGQLIGFVPVTRESATDEEFKALVEPIRARWEKADVAADRRSLGEALTNLYDQRADPEGAAEVLRRRLEREKEEAYRPGLASQLIARLLKLPHTLAIEDEVFALVPQVVAGEKTWAPELIAQTLAVTVRTVVDGLLNGRITAALGPVLELEKLSRAERKDRTAKARFDARRALGDRLAMESDGASDALRPWFVVEALGLAVEAHGASALLEAGAREILLSPPAVAAPGLAWVLEERCSLTLEYMATRRNAPEDLVGRVVSLTRERAAEAGEEDLSDRRYRVFRLLVALDRAAEVRDLVASWIEAGKVEGVYRIALANLLAEEGRLADAAKVLEAVAAMDQLSAGGYATLADWYLALGEDDRREAALDQRYRETEEWQLGQMLWTEQARISRPGPDGVPPDLDPEVLRIERILFGKASSPANYVYQVREIYNQTKDFRLVAAIANGITGHSPEAIYPFLTTAWQQLLQNVHEEATLDEVAARIRDVAETAKTGADKRGILYLIALVERRAAEVKNRPELHAEKALPALKAAFPTEWLPGEPALLAAFLASLGTIPDAALAAEQLSQLGRIHAAADPRTGPGLDIAAHFARALWGYSRADEAMDILASALDAHRTAHDGRLPQAVFHYVDILVSWFETKHLYLTGEKYLTGERERQTDDGPQAWLTLRLFDLYPRAIRTGSAVSLGEGAEIYRRGFELMKAALFTLPASEVDQVVTKITTLAQAAANRPASVAGVPSDLARFARGTLREAFPRAPDREQDMWNRVAQSVYGLGDKVGALTLLVEKIESDPEWYSWVGRDGWRTFAYSMARWRAEGAATGKLADRLLKIVVAKLEEELRTGEARGQNFYHRQASWFWSERAGEFATAARRVVELEADSPSILLRCAVYLWDGLNLRTEAVDVLVDQDDRIGLPEDSRFQLGVWQQELGRHKEAARNFRRLLDGNPDRLDARGRLVVSLHEIGQDEEAHAILDAGEARLREQGNWNQDTIAVLGEACFTAGYFDYAARYFEEIVRIYDRWRQGGYNDPGMHAYYYGRLAMSLVKIGREDEAVRAAGSAVVVFGNRMDQRANALQSLRTVLADLSDLDAFIARHDAEVAETGLDAPVVRQSLGRVFMDRKVWAKALAQLEIARDLQPADAETHRLIVECHDQAGDADGAIAALFTAIRTTSGDIPLLTDLGDRLEKAGREAEAERAYTTLVEGAPLEAAGHSKLAEIRERQKDPDAAIEQREIAKRLREFDPAVWFELAKTLKRAGRTDEAKAVLAEMIARTWGKEFGDVKRKATRLMR